MKKYSNTYIFIYITLLVTLIALVLGVVALWLNPYQKANRKKEEQAQILKAAGYDIFPTTKVLKLFAEVTQIDTIITDKKAEKLVVYTVTTPSDSVAYVIPLRGKGLWGPLWGYVAIAEDGNHIIGIVFGHKSETPGLGAQISTEKFTSTFKGKLLFNENENFVSIKVVKGGVENSRIPLEHGVDAITGGTITSRGVEEMIEQSLLPYIPFLQQLLLEKSD